MLAVSITQRKWSDSYLELLIWLYIFLFCARQFFSALYELNHLLITRVHGGTYYGYHFQIGKDAERQEIS